MLGRSSVGVGGAVRSLRVGADGSRAPAQALGGAPDSPGKDGACASTAQATAAKKTTPPRSSRRSRPRRTESVRLCGESAYRWGPREIVSPRLPLTIVGEFQFLTELTQNRLYRDSLPRKQVWTEWHSSWPQVRGGDESAYDDQREIWHGELLRRHRQVGVKTGRMAAVSPRSYGVTVVPRLSLPG